MAPKASQRKKLTKAKLRNKFPGPVKVIKMPDYSKDPYFIKKAEDARAFIEKHGLPKDF